MGNVASLWTLTNSWLWRSIPPMCFFSRAMSYKLTFDNYGLTSFLAIFFFFQSMARAMWQCFVFCSLFSYHVEIPSCSASDRSKVHPKVHNEKKTMGTQRVLALHEKWRWKHDSFFPFLFCVFFSSNRFYKIQQTIWSFIPQFLVGTA